MRTHQITQADLERTKQQPWVYPGATRPGAYTYNENDNTYTPIASAPVTEESPHDFSHSGLGIGGLATHEEMPIVPTVAQIARVEKMERGMTTCRRCGDNDGPYGDARFGNGGGDICDDCLDY